MDQDLNFSLHYEYQFSYVWLKQLHEGTAK
jgi:hypothetical protein